MKKAVAACLLAVLGASHVAAETLPEIASEVFPDTGTRVVVRHHPKTGKPYVCIAGAAPSGGILRPDGGDTKRPDYRLLDPKAGPGQIPYDGPSSDRRKVYFLAAGLAAAGVAGGLAVQAAVPAASVTASTGGAAGGAGAYAAAGSALTAGTISSAWLQSRPDPADDDFSRRAESILLVSHGPATQEDSGSQIISEPRRNAAKEG